jgi:O-antigen/teichoic acid export membrane protein
LNAEKVPAPVVAAMLASLPFLRQIGIMIMSVAFLLNAMIQFGLGLLVAYALGPERFGFYALALAAAVLVQTGLFEWIRLSVTRFYHAEAVGLHMALDRQMRGVSGILLAVSLVLAMFGGRHRWVFALVPLIAIAAGWVDYRAALFRARFDQRAFASLTMLRNLLAVVLVPLAAFWTMQAEAVLAAYLLSLLAAYVISGGMAGRTPPVAPSLDRLSPCFAYAWPIVATNLAYLAMFFWLRTQIAVQDGLAASGQFSLAFDVGFKLFATIGAAMDLLLFQQVLDIGRRDGQPQADAKLQMNAVLLLAVLLPLAFGLWLVLPSVEILLVPPDFRGGFARYLLALAPGLVLYCCIQYALHPFLQFSQETGRLLISGLMAFAALVIVLAILGMDGRLVSSDRAGLAFGVAVAVAAGSLLIRIGSPLPKGWHAPVQIGVSLLAMIAACRILPALEPGFFNLIVTGLTGAMVYAACIYMLDLAHIRSKGWR